MKKITKRHHYALAFKVAIAAFITYAMASCEQKATTVQTPIEIVAADTIPPVNCETPNTDEIPAILLDKRRIQSNPKQVEKVVGVYFEVDYNLYVASGRDIKKAESWARDVFKQVQAIYTADTIRIKLDSVFVRTSEFYPPKETISKIRSLFKARVSDANILLTGRNIGGVAGGTGILCTTGSNAACGVNYAYAQYPAYSHTVKMIAHELGHILGSGHTHDCVWNNNNTAIDYCGKFMTGTISAFPCKVGGWKGDEIPINDPSMRPKKGTIMSYCDAANIGVDLKLGFGKQPRERMKAFIAASPCLSAYAPPVVVAPSPTAIEIFVNNKGWARKTYALSGVAESVNWTHTTYEGTYCISSNTTANTGLQFTGKAGLSGKKLTFKFKFADKVPAGVKLLSSVDGAKKSGAVDLGVSLAKPNEWQTITVDAAKYGVTDITSLNIRLDGFKGKIQYYIGDIRLK